MLQGRNPYDTRRKARKIIDGKLEQSGWVIQDLAIVNPMASLGVAEISGETTPSIPTNLTHPFSG